MAGEQTTTSAAPAADTTPEEIERDIEQTRADLGETVDALTARVDPKVRAKEAADRAKDSVRQQGQAARSAAVDVASRLRSATTDETGRPTPLAAAAAAAVAAALVVTIVIVRRR